MGRDKAKDDELFNCSQDYEIDYVANLYGNRRKEVRDFLSQKCKEGTIKNFTHKQVYELIRTHLHLPLP